VTTRQTGDVTRKAGDTNMNQRHKFDAPVPKNALKSRRQSGQNLTYLDSHYIITMTNELLGHENWSYTVGNFQVVQQERKKGTGENATEKEYVGYVAQATVTWNGVTRSDVGFGQGIDNDLGRAHESAIKEAATDALKRALRTFGQAFGLALYDKSGAHIGDPEPEPPVYNAGEFLASLGLAKEDKAHLLTMFGDNRPKVLKAAWENNVSDRESMMAFADSYHCQEAGA
jgi:DNA repair and recombination protein RAD52